MATMLEKALKRELTIGADHYMLTISPDGLKLVPKGKRNGVELQWPDLVSGEAALAVALNASVGKLGGAATRTSSSQQTSATSPQRPQATSAVPSPPVTITSPPAATVSTKARSKAPAKSPTKATVVKRGRAR